MTVSALDHRVTGYQLDHAYWLGKAAKLAYSGEEEIRAETARWGFDRFRFLHVVRDLPVPLDDTQAYLAASDHMIILAFRGTEITQIKDWLTDATTPVAPGPADRGLVHLGFDQALATVLPLVCQGIKELRTNDQSIWLTGHSLGGALAMLAAATLYFEDPNLTPDGVYTFGQPRTCDPRLAHAYDEALEGRTFRFVNNNDIVPQLPPEPVFRHVKAARYFDRTGALHEQLSLWGGIADKVGGHTDELLLPGSDALKDHPMDRYLENIEKNL
ncbi:MULTISPECIES: lipase family protein [Actinoalloteichus]|uniref:Lipase (Class 3) n=1 Tax=Actinoalloteichus fjordicus TaxID=1612552 RepID=A0AAC9L9G2_9PSEU|nr:MULTISPECIES: lipase family protein [Actinoalloteichus]APU13396.1 Lipase (class 3) [Actinoalloteichus fjordicus]APU19346.1 Lipase (class 3) [Actinoalloteichus sp. GBA129-24]